MIRPRTRDRGHFGGRPHPELMILIAIIAVLLAVAIPNLIRFWGSRGPKCLDHLAALTAGPLPPDVVCPASKVPYPPVKRDGVEVAVCASPAGHADSNPRLVRAGQGPWRLEQILPVTSGAPVQLADGRVEVHESPGRVSLLAKPGIAARFVVGPVLFLILAGLTLLFGSALVTALKEKRWGELTAPFLAAAVTGLFSTVALGGMAMSHEWILEAAPSRVTRIDYFLGMPGKKTVLEGCLGVVPTTEKGNPGKLLRVVHAPDAQGRRTTALESIPADRPDLASWFSRALPGP